MGTEQAPVQQNFAGTQEKRRGDCLIQSGTVIWPSRTGRGVVQKNFCAEKIDHEIKGLTGFRVKNNGETVLLYLGGYWRISDGSLFGAYSNNCPLTDS